MPTKTARPTKQDLENLLDEIAEASDEALDPELTREELVAKVKAIADLASGDEQAEESDEEEDEE